MPWPRGRYNGLRIVGVVVKLRVDVTYWRLRWFGPYGTCLSVGPVHVWVEWEYELPPKEGGQK